MIGIIIQIKMQAFHLQVCFRLCTSLSALYCLTFFKTSVYKVNVQVYLFHLDSLHKALLRGVKGTLDGTPTQRGVNDP